MLDERLIVMDADVETAEDCIRLMGKYFEEYGYVKEGYAFSPMFTLGYRKTISDKEVFATWLNLAKAN